MQILEIASGTIKKVSVSSVQEDDYKTLTKKRYFFNWKALKTSASIYKLQLYGEDDILGLLALVDFPAECRTEIKLLASSRENVGEDKMYSGIAACLIAFACRESVKKYADMACVSLVPKTALKQHYIQKYNMTDAGWQLFIEGRPLFELIKKYL